MGGKDDQVVNRHSPATSQLCYWVLDYCCASFAMSVKMSKRNDSERYLERGGHVLIVGEGPPTTSHRSQSPSIGT